MPTYKVYVSQAGIPETGLTLTWESLKNVADSANVTPQPTFDEIGGGWYKYDHTIPSDEQHVGVIDASASVSLDTDRYIPVDMHPNDFDLDAHPINSNS